MKTTEIIELLTKKMNETEEKAEEYSNNNEWTTQWYKGKAAGLDEAIVTIAKEYGVK